MRLLLSAALLAALAACANEPTRVSATNPMVSYRYDGDNLDQARARAAEYCRGYGLPARLRNVTQQGMTNIAHFECG